MIFETTIPVDSVARRIFVAAITEISAAETISGAAIMEDWGPEMLSGTAITENWGAETVSGTAIMENWEAETVSWRQFVEKSGENSARRSPPSTGFPVSMHLFLRGLLFLRELLDNGSRPPLNRLFALLIFALNGTAFAVEAPYTENFDTYPDGGAPGNFSTHVSGGGVFFTSAWDIQNPSGTAGAYRNQVAGDVVEASAAVNVTNLAQSDFLLSTTFVVNGFGSFQPTFTNIRVGLGAFASNADFSMSGYQLYYELANVGSSIPPVGTLDLYRNNFAFGDTGFTALSVTIGTIYTMTLMGDYSPSGLQLMATLSDGSSSLSLAANDPNPLQGTYFGYYDDASGLVNHAVYADVSYDNFSLTVPEPCIVWLFVVGVAAMGMRRVWREIRDDVCGFLHR